MEDHLKESEWLSTFSLSEDNAINILSFAEVACGEGGRKKVTVLENERAVEVAEIRRYVSALQENQDRYYKELQDANQYLKEKLSGLQEFMERAQK